MHLSYFVAILIIILGAQVSHAQELPVFDLTQPQSLQGWVPVHDVGDLQTNPEGLVIAITGSDPYIMGPARDYPANTPLWLHLRLKSDQPGDGQIFYFKDAPTEGNSVHFMVKGGDWQDIRLPLPALGPGYRLRLDPPGTGGQAVVGSIRFAPRILLQEPAWPKPIMGSVRGKTHSLRSGELRFEHGAGGLGDFRIWIANRLMANGLSRPLLGYETDKGARWLDIKQMPTRTHTNATGGMVMTTTTLRDLEGATWQIKEQFSTSTGPGTLKAEIEVTVDRDRAIVFLPMLMLLPGVNSPEEKSFGTAKTQALFPGLEYLDNEPSSSEADIIGPQSRRQVPDTLKITFPLMAMHADDRYLGLIWDQQRDFSAVFDSPDRLFKSGGHVMGVIFPGSNGANRVEGNLLPYQGQLLLANNPLVLRAQIMGGWSESIVPAVQRYVQLRGLPPLPNTGMDFQSYTSLAAAGWLDSRVREGKLFRHAYWPGFAPQPAADAPLLMEWLARQSTNAELATRLREVAREALSSVSPENYNFAYVSHVTYPAASLVYGNVAENAARAEQSARDILKRFEPDGTILYKTSEGRPDYGKTHFARHANGLTGQVVWSLLEAASISGNPQLIQEAIRRLRALDQYTNTVPRGAQTWEVPLHTPDILASAYLVRAYTRGYELTEDRHFLQQARYWAWTGVPFVYLSNPTGQRVGPYSTIAVLGATNWQAPVWFGQPVQWCGLVYADALYRLVSYDPTGPWQRLADGITATGIQHTWPLSDKERQGLLPDFYHLRPQISDGPAINPGTVQTNAVRLFRKTDLYDFHAFRRAGMLVHAPGDIKPTLDSLGRIHFTVQGWSERPYYVLINGITKTPRIRTRLTEGHLPVRAPHQFVAEKGHLILQIQGSPDVEILVG